MRMRRAPRGLDRTDTFTITIHPYASQGTDALGNQVTSFGPDIESEGWSITGGKSSEETDVVRNPVTVPVAIRTTGTAPITARDEVTLPTGIRYEVDGDPQVTGVNPFTGRGPHTTVHLLLTKG